MAVLDRLTTGAAGGRGAELEAVARAEVTLQHDDAPTQGPPADVERGRGLVMHRRGPGGGPILLLLLLLHLHHAAPRQALLLAVG